MSGHERAGNPNAVLVLDLDDTLVHTFMGEDEESQQRLADIVSSKKAGSRLQSINFIDSETGVSYKMKTVLRPGIDDFLDTVQKQGFFKKVVVWTAADKNYAEAIVKAVFCDGPQPDLVWSRSNCYDFGADISKPLIVMARELGVRPENIFIIDDMKYSVGYNRKHGIQIPPYDPVTGDDNEDDCLPLLIKFFKSPHFYMYRYPKDCDQSMIGWTKPLNP